MDDQELEVTAPHLLGEEVSQQFRLLVESVVDYAIFMLDVDGYIISWNRGAQRIKGYTAEEAIGQHFSMFYPEAERIAGKPARIIEAARMEGSCEDEGWRIRKDGTRFWANVVVTALRGPEGTIVGYAKVTRDSTNRKLADEALHRSEEKFRRLVESVRDYAIYMLSIDGKIISWNAGAQRMKGYLAEEVLGRHFSIFYPPEDVESGKPTLGLEVVLAEGRFEEEGWRVRKDGTRFWANVIITPIRDQDSKLIGFAKVTRDLTERRRARETLLASQRQIADLNRSAFGQDELFSVISHELRGPLSVVYGTAELLRNKYEAIPAEQRQELMNALAQESIKAVRLIEDFRVLGRMEPSELSECDLQECLVAAVASFERSSPLRKVIVRDAGPITVRIEQSYFDRVLQNLLENADKYSAQHKPIEVVVCEPAGGKVAIEVLDRGPGVDPTELDLIFESFYRSKQTSSSVLGKGLGLSVCKRLVESMGGSIEARPRAGGGLCVRQSLLAADKPSPDVK